MMFAVNIGIAMADFSSNKTVVTAMPDGTCSRCRYADFDDDPPLCWRMGTADLMPATRCIHFDLDEAFK